MLRLLETFPLAEVVRQALHLGALTFDAVKYLLLCQIGAAAAAAGSGLLSVSAVRSSGNHCCYRLLIAAERNGRLMDIPQVLLDHHLKALRLPTFLRSMTR